MDDEAAIHAALTVLETIQAHPKTQAVFEEYSRRTGTCILCCNLFETLHWVADTHDLSERQLLHDLRQAALGRPFFPDNQHA